MMVYIGEVWTKQQSAIGIISSYKELFYNYTEWNVTYIFVSKALWYKQSANIN